MIKCPICHSRDYQTINKTRHPLNDDYPTWYYIQECNNCEFRFLVHEITGEIKK
jgi:hypothetical protein